MMRAGGGVAALLLTASCTTAPRLAIPPAIALVPATVAAGPARFAWTRETMQGGLIAGTAPQGTVTLTLDGQPIPLAGDRFIAGFDRDAGPVAVLAATLADGRVVTERLAIGLRDWDISRLPTLARTPVPAPAFDRLRPPELAAITAARSLRTDAAGWTQRFVWPTTGRISTHFGAQRIYANGEAGAYHSGIDIARAAGTPVVAPADGVVILAAGHPFTLEGNLLMIDHGMGLNSAFLHLSRIDVAAGDHVRRGQPIGLVGMTGRATGPHLHWSLRWHEAKLDPLLVTGPM